MTKVLFIPADVGGCGCYRIFNQFKMLSLKHQDSICPFYIGAAHLHYVGEDIVFTQRNCSKYALDTLYEYKQKHNVKIVIDYDDLVWSKDKSLHKYNMYINDSNTTENYHAMKEGLDRTADLITVTNEALKAELLDFVSADKVKVIPNYLTISDWCFDRTTMIPRDDVFFYAGSPTHYNNEKKMYGDFDHPLANFLKKSIVEFQGVNPPWFLTPRKVHDWTDMTVYSRALYQNTRNCKFTIAPLANNKFNRCKSDLKYIESCAVGRVCLVSDFEGSPYHNAHPYQKIPEGASIKDIQEIVENCKQHYGEILDYQYNYLNERWLDQHIDEYSNFIGENV